MKLEDRIMKPLIDIPTRTARIINLIHKEIDFLSRERISVGVLLMLPIFIIAVTGTANFPTFAAPDALWIIDEDRTDLSNQLIEVIREESDFEVITNYDNPNISIAVGREQLPTEGLSAVIYIPKGFENQLETNGSTQIDIYIDAYEMQDKTSIQAAIQLALVRFQLDYGNFESDVFYFPRFEPEVTEDVLKLSAPNVIAMSLFASLNLIASQSIVADKPLKRILTTPTHRFEVIIAKTISYGAIAFLSSLSTLFLWDFVFGGNTYTRGIFLDLFLVCFLCAQGGVSLGILFSVISSTRLQAAQMFLFYFIIGMVFFLNLRIGIALIFIPFEQAENGIVAIAYRGLGLKEVLVPIMNMGITIVTAFLLSTILFIRKKELV